MKYQALKGFMALACLLVGCGTDAGLYNVSLKATMVADGDVVGFVTPAGSVVAHSVSDLVGKPYMIATYPAGFSPGNDPAIESVWGTVPEGLEINFESDSIYGDGPYDIVLAVYVVTEVPTEQMTPEGTAPAPVQGDLATFTISQSEVREGDPTIMPGVLRLNVEGGDAMVAVENRLPSESEDGVSLTEAMTNTLMVIP